MMSEEILGPKLKELQYYCSGKIGWASEEERKRGAREEREKQETVFSWKAKNFKKGELNHVHAAKKQER